MSADVTWWAALLVTDTPALPGALLMQYYLHLSWIFPFSLLAAFAGWKLPLHARRIFSIVVGSVCVFAGSAFPMYWLGLAFQAPSISAVLLLGMVYIAAMKAPGKLAVGHDASGINIRVLSVLVLPGYLLLLDTFAVLPWQIYAWGFSPLALLCLLTLSLLPGVLHGARKPMSAPEAWVAPIALLFFAVTRLPTGNVWDALIDPWLWFFLNGMLLRAFYLRWRGVRSEPATF